MNIYVNASDFEETKKLTELGYNVVPLCDMGFKVTAKIKAIRISVAVMKTPVWNGEVIAYLTRGAEYPVIEKNGNFVIIEGGGYVYLDHATVEYMEV